MLQHRNTDRVSRARARVVGKWFVVAAILTAGLLARGATPAPTQPTMPADLLPDGRWALSRPSAGDATLEVLKPEDVQTHGSKVLRLAVFHPSDPVYAIQIGRTIDREVAVDHLVRLTFRARSDGGNPMRVVVEQAGPPYRAIASITPTLAGEWKRYETLGTSAGFGPGQLALRFQAGFRAGVIELADIHLIDDGPDPAMLAAREAIAPQLVAERIERYRKRDLRIEVVDAAGKPVPGAAVHVRQTRHAFLFGCNIFFLRVADRSPHQLEYQARFAELFNYATLPFYWGSFERVRGQRDYERLTAMADWCTRHDITTKGHPLIWHEVYPTWAPRKADQTIPLLHDRVSDLVTHFRGTIDIWDVVNEANAAPNYANTGVGDWALRDGPAAVVGTALGWARDAAKRQATQPIDSRPAETFLYNDYETGPANLALLKALQARGELPDAIGIQSHMHAGEWPLEQVWAVAQRFAAFGRPVHFTETTALSGAHGPIHPRAGRDDWVTTPEGEKRQAEYLERFYSILFSHPAIAAITYWDLTDDGAWLNAPAGMLRKDMSPKPAYVRLMDLIHRRWWTDVELRTDHAGTCSARAFLGNYEITTADERAAGRTARVTLAPGTGAVTVRLSQGR